MSIISDALKKVEGNSVDEPPMKRNASPVDRENSTPPAVSPPLFSVWSIILSTVMVLIAATLLFVTWYMNGRQSPATPRLTQTSPVSPVAVTSAPMSSVTESVAIAPVVPTAPTTTAHHATALAQPDVPPVAAPPPQKATPPHSVEATSETLPEAPPAVVASEAPSKVPAASPAQERDELVLTGVVYTPRVRMAHINGKILPEGAKIKGYRIVTIARESVRLSKNDQFYILRLKR